MLLREFRQDIDKDKQGCQHNDNQGIHLRVGLREDGVEQNNVHNLQYLYGIVFTWKYVPATTAREIVSGVFYYFRNSFFIRLTNF